MPIPKPKTRKGLIGIIAGAGCSLEDSSNI